MTLILKPEMLRSAYDFLRTTPPFSIRGWRLPPGEEVEFRIMRQADRYGQRTNYCWRPNEHIIDISEKCVGHTITLITTMAHEMVHAVQIQYRHATPNAEHNADFWRRWADVAAIHGFDPKTL